MTIDIEEVSAYIAYCNECDWEGEAHVDDEWSAEKDVEHHKTVCPHKAAKSRYSEREAWQRTLDIAAGIITEEDEEDDNVGYRL